MSYPSYFSNGNYRDSVLLFYSVDTKKKTFMEKVIFDRNHWEKVLINLDIFYKTSVCPARLNFCAATFCAKCDKALLEETEISTHKQSDLSSIYCDICGAWFHYKCEIMPSSFVTELDWTCSAC